MKTDHSLPPVTQVARYVAAPLVDARLNYRSAPEPCVFTGQFKFCLFVLEISTFYNDKSH